MKKVFFLVAVAVVIAFLVSEKGISAQENFNLQSKNGHFYFLANVADAQTDVMLESGLPALLVSRSFYENTLKNTGLTFQPSTSEIKLLNTTYKIPFRAEGKVKVGNVVFDGPVFVLDEFIGIRLPIQYLKMADGENAYITINFHEKTMSVNSQKPNEVGEVFKLRIDKKFGFPIIDGVIEMTSETGETKLKGDFIVDFGNPELLFLMKQHKNVIKAMPDEKYGIDIIDPNTYEVVGQSFKMKSVTICGRKFEQRLIGLTDQMPAIEQMGFIGIPFFQKTVVFDFSGGEMRVQ